MYNTDIYDKGINNRIAFVNPYSFHPNLIMKALEN